ncbi:MAG: dicarboxylate/amino acid:cation symporter [Terrisporobacter othiniensis]|uniref:Dicarboxylate/amino acid:cation symporter n=1 Tax=Terrisporobacter hibernicus TaxID=2813371 RepID=A0AAX2ZH82_9FIRM|nr:MULTISPECIES: dicarboxylate/amino acid:cation symporter [Terrisporobacter]MDU4860503.1 dicarboxylate/amino acid:cation symporter [Terrisporobacter othiniensis]MDU6993268.1 dicarboxylate/amino acid:cation symporter [Terrisporobacter othiniensis]UEL48426.1 dicarboxylate/amino acid:cation symporter [Terrisporobacter hibernicus]HBI92271.1 dicarboxylate/amino acid:cation symporter [Terrisporobacter hibernicus]
MKKKIGLVPKLILGIIVGILLGSYAPEVLVRVLITASTLFSAFLKFVIPFIIIGFVTAGIADLATGAGKLLGITTGIAYGSTIVAGTAAFLVASTIFPAFIDSSVASQIGDPEAGMLSPFFTIPLEPMVDVTAAIVFAFTIGLGISSLRNHGKGETLHKVFQEFQEIVTKTLATAIIPLLPVYIAGTFANITYAGQVGAILGVFWKVFLIVIPMHLIYLVIQFTVAGTISGKNPFKMLKNQIPGYLTAVGTQSSAATIPVNVECAKNNGVSKEIREFCVPLCATIHLAGSIISVTSFSVAVLMMNNMDFGFGVMLPFILMLGIAMVAAPGAPGGAIMSALPFLPMIGIPSDGGLASLMIALYLTQDSFGTAANVSGDNAIAVVVDHINQKMNKKEKIKKIS